MISVITLRFQVHGLVSVIGVVLCSAIVAWKVPMGDIRAIPACNLPFLQSSVSTCGHVDPKKTKLVDHWTAIDPMMLDSTEQSHPDNHRPANVVNDADSIVGLLVEVQLPSSKLSQQSVE